MKWFEPVSQCSFRNRHLNDGYRLCIWTSSAHVTMRPNICSLLNVFLLSRQPQYLSKAQCRLHKAIESITPHNRRYLSQVIECVNNWRNNPLLLSTVQTHIAQCYCYVNCVESLNCDLVAEMTIIRDRIHLPRYYLIVHFPSSPPSTLPGRPNSPGKRKHVITTNYHRHPLNIK